MDLTDKLPLTTLVNASVHPFYVAGYEAGIAYERERCAVAAECYGGVWLVRLSAENRPAKFLRDKVQHKMETADAIAAIIRKAAAAPPAEEPA